tara:strand:- start:68 stop:943 length:876 start_codon:yes stop_codon:yes gene_type:complete
MVKYIIVLIVFFSSSVFSEENLLTIKQQLDRLQREVNDLSKIVFQNEVHTITEKNDNQDSANISAFDMRIYDLENDIKNLNSTFENFVFKIDEIEELVEEIKIKLDNTVINASNVESMEAETDVLVTEDEKIESKNTLGSLKINSEDLSQDSEDIQKTTTLQNIDLDPDEQFQIAFDLLRSQQFDKAKEALNEFIDNNSDNNLSGSAHYWLGEIYLLKKDYREAALVLAEGYQKYPKSVKAPDSLYKLSEALSKIDKNFEACNTLNKFNKEHPKHKLSNKANLKIQELKCE